MKPSIYDQELKTPSKSEPPTELELYTRKFRDATRILDLNLVQYERKFLKYVDSSEAKLDNLGLVIISYFSGSIIAQNKSLIGRIGIPMVVSITAFGYLMPKTSRNIFNALK